VLAGIASHVIAPAFNANPPYDGVRDFTHIAYLGGPPVGLLVHPALGLAGYREFLAFAKASPVVLDYTSSGTGTLGFIGRPRLCGAEYAPRAVKAKGDGS
jgi:tripartite-type tricarboxylate transporter receptor subunit TctC